jgi:hypothetical protein
MVRADGIGGIIEFGYSRIDTKTSDVSGSTTETESESLRQRYRLTMDKTIYPFLRLSAGGLFERTNSKTRSEDSDTESTSTKINPFLDITLSNPFLSAGAGYNRVEEKQKSDGVSSPTNIRENYNLFLGVRPVGLPPAEIRLSRSHLFDKEKAIRDNITDSLMFTTRYNFRDLRLSYMFNYSDNQDKLKEFESKSSFHNVMATYSTRLFKDRTSFYTSYNLSRQEVQTFSKGVGGESLLQVFPDIGLSGLDDTPNEGALDSNSAIIDRDLAESSGINIGVVPVGGDTRKRNVGIGFIFETELNTLYVYVHRELPPTIFNSFSWSIYTSSDNQTWSLLTTLSSAFFDTFQRRFEIRIPNIKKKYIKVVTNPLSAATAALVPDFSDPDKIFITEIQAFNAVPSKDIVRRFTTTTNVFNLGARTMILEYPFLMHDLSFWYNKTSPMGASRYMMSNGLTLMHKLSRVLSGSARVSVDNSKSSTEEIVNYQYSASLTATPLETLSHNIVFSRRITNRDGKSSDSNSIFINNSAQLYKGVDVSLSGGVSFSTSETGEKTTSTILNFGASIMPRENLSLSTGFSETKTRQTRRVTEDTESLTRSAFLSFTYSPFRTLYLFGAIDRVTQKNREPVTTLNYAMTFSPFRDGSLLFNFSYNESLRLEDEEKTRNITPSIRWNITRRSYLDLSYNLIKTSSLTEESEIKIFGANLRVTF